MVGRAHPGSLGLDPSQPRIRNGRNPRVGWRRPKTGSAVTVRPPSVRRLPALLPAIDRTGRPVTLLVLYRGGGPPLYLE